MKKSERFALIHKILGGSDVPVTAGFLATKCGVTVRTIYRDISALRTAGHPIAGDTVPGGGLWIESPTTSFKPIPAPRPVTAFTRYVGRPVLMDRLHAVIARALTGNFQAVLLSGEPGSGKTRSAREAANLAQGLGFEIYWGRSYDGVGAPPLWPWIQILRQIAVDVPPEVTVGMFSEDLSLVSRLVPELAQGDRSDLPDAPGETVHLYEAIIQFVGAIAATRPMFIMLDDLQWADEESIELLRYMVEAAPSERIVLLGGFRQTEVLDKHPLTEAMGRMQRSDHFGHVPISALSSEEMNELLASLSKDGIDLPTIEEFAERSEGNPFFGIQLVESHLSLQATGVDTPDYVLPYAIRDAVGARLSRLEKSSRELLNIAAVVGREFEVRVVEHLFSSGNVSGILAILDPVVKAGFVERGTQFGTYRFSHDLIRQATLDDLDSVEAVRLHQLVAVALEVEYSESLNEVAARIAVHYENAVVVSGSDPVVRWSIAAGWHALNMLAFPAAERHFENALVHKKGSEALRVFDSESAMTEIGLRQQSEVAEGGDLELGQILHGMMRAYAALESSKGVLGCLKGAFDIYVANDAIEEALNIADYPFASGLGTPPQSVILTTALELVEPGSLQHARLLSRYGIHNLFLEGDVDISISRDSAEQATVIARREGDRLLEAWAVSRHLQGEFMSARFNSARLLVEPGLMAAEASGDREVLSNVWAWATDAAVMAGDFERGMSYLNRAMSLARLSGHRFRLRRAHILNYTMGILGGEWGKVVESMEYLQSETLSEFSGFQHEYYQYLTHFETSDLSQKDIDGMINACVSLEPIWGRFTAQGSAFLRLITGIASSTNRSDLVKITGDDAVVDEAGRRDLPILYLYRAVQHGVTAVIDGDVSDANSAYEVLVAFGDLSHPDNAYHGSVSRVLGQLAAKMGNGQDAERHFEYSIGWFRNGGFGPDLAWTCHDYAAALLQRRRRVDTVRVRNLVREGQGVAARLGMLPLLRRLQDLEVRLGERASGVTEYPDGLTEREVAVLRHMAGGLTNRQIAEVLFITQNTVESHVRNVLNKTNTQNRAEAAQYATRRDLV